MKFQNEDKLLNLIKDQVDKRPPFKDIAVLDADGTLWPEDANDILLRYEIRKKLRDFEDILAAYYRKAGHHHKFCELFAQRQAGWTPEEFKFHCSEALKEEPLHVFSFQKALLQYLKQQGMRVYVVTASVKWLVETAIEICELPVDKVLGVQTQLDEGVLGSEIVRPTPVAGFKGEVFLKHGQGEHCFLAGGNTVTDLPLLEMAEVPFVVCSAFSGHMMFPAERKLKDLAVQKDWIVFQAVNH